jgi:2-dehydro-3-deoxygalactonokinase
MATHRTALIGLDWGVSSLRAWRIAGDGAILDGRRAPGGIVGVGEGGFPAAFAAAVGDWSDAHPQAPVLLCGMIGSRQGWVEAAYAPAPARLADLAARLAPVEIHGRLAARIVPGVSLREGARREVMRGEETQIVGAAGAGERLVVLPGSHSKWARVADAALIDFSTFVTGELFAALKGHTILGRGFEAGGDAAGAARGFAEGLEAARGGLAGALFQTRARMLLGALPAQEAEAFLSGLLIGAEIEEGLARLGTPVRAPLLVGAPGLVARYAAAFAARGIEIEVAGEETAAAGLFAIARAARLI